MSTSAERPAVHVTAIVAAGGHGRRMGAAVPKQLLEIAGRPILQHSVEAFLSHPLVADVVVALPESLADAPPGWLAGVRVVRGGARRQDSVANAFEAVSEQSDVVLIHDGARPFVSRDLISRAIDGALRHGAAIAALPVTDTVKRVGDPDEAMIMETLPREQIYLAQTPQAFRRDVLRDAIAFGRRGGTGTDEATLAERVGHRVHIVAGDPANAKITTEADLELARHRSAGAAGDRIPIRVGLGYDLHRLVEGRPLILGGVRIESDRGALGHSDADVVCHAVTDAVLGAARAGDIGEHFPDTDARWKDASSIDLLRSAVARVAENGLRVQNVDVVVILERPRLGRHRAAIEKALAEAVGIDRANVSVKAKTNEGMDAVGRGEAIAAHAVALLRSWQIGTADPCV